MDVLLIKPLNHLLTSQPSGGVTLAHEGIDGTIGAGNALMLCARNASFLNIWYDRYHSFSDQIWNGFSVRQPMDLAMRRPGQVRLLDYTAFYWPPWNPWGIAQLYRTPKCVMHESMGVHLWETKMWKSLLSNLTPDLVRKRDSCFASLAAAVLDSSFEFGAATLAEGQTADEDDSLIQSTDLSQLLAVAPTPGLLESRPTALPPEMAKWRRK